LCFTLHLEKGRFPGMEMFFEALERDGVAYNRTDAGISRGRCAVVTFDDRERERVIAALSELIIHDYIPVYILKMLDTKYRYFNGDEKNKIIDELCDYLDRPKLRGLLDEYMKENQILSLGGFLTFRLKDYFSVLDGDIDFTVDEFLVRKEYLEFVKLLQFFVNMQETVYEELHLIITGDFTYRLIDGKGNPVNMDDLRDVACEVGVIGAQESDMLLSTLITFAPKRLVIHGRERFLTKDVLETVVSVFSDRVTECKGCPLCMNGLPALEKQPKESLEKNE